MNEAALEALTRVELRDAELLAWGAVGAQWNRDELLAVLGPPGDAEAMLDELEEAALIVRTPDGAYRTRSAETIRLLAHLRQAFDSQPVSAGQPLILDYRYIHRARRRPRRDIPAADVVEAVRGLLGKSAADCAAALAPPQVSAFQRRSTDAVIRTLRGAAGGGVVVTAGTGSGKSLAFYLPLLSYLVSRPQNGTAALALYPRNELLKDQLRGVLEFFRRIDDVPSVRRLSVATWFGDTPKSAYYVLEGWAAAWTPRKAGYVCPFLQCIECKGDLIWPTIDLKANREVLRCAECSWHIDGERLRLTRDSARKRPADLMLTSTESLNRQLAAPGNLKAFGIKPSTLQAVLLDEAHIYEGTGGAQNALLLRRLKHALGRAPAWVGLSATLRNAGEFFAQLVNTPPSAVTVVHPESQEMEDAGAEYLLALRHDPHSSTGVLSATIQTCMALARCLDAADQDPFDPAPTSGKVFGSRLFAFADKLDSTNRLYWDFLHAEGQYSPGRHLTRNPLTLAHLRSEEQQRLKAGSREHTDARDQDGQWWWLPQKLGHKVEEDVPLRIGRTSSQDRGVSEDAQVVIATASLEVGFDDERVGAVVQHKAPHDSAQFLQRKGRAGRNVLTRPWTVVVLSDWGADRRAWESYDQLFDPELPPRNLPLDNRYVIRIQAVYSLLDWLAQAMDAGSDHSAWADLSGPADALHSRAHLVDDTRKRQHRAAEHLEKLLRPGPEREGLRRHLQHALGLTGPDGARALDSVLWDAPRPLLLAVVPTMRRRLIGQWTAEEPMKDDPSLRTRTPLREFVPGNLFDELLVPDVELTVPGKSRVESVEHLPALRAITEFCPGNVTRHFGIWASSKRHWIPLVGAVDEAGSTRADVMALFGATFVDVVAVGDDEVAVYAPARACLETVPESVKDATSMRPDWIFHFSPLGAGWQAGLEPRANVLLSSLTAHLHADGGGARVMRFARSASGTRWEKGAVRTTAVFGTVGDGEWHPAGIGIDIYCDALVGEVQIPEPDGLIAPEERSERVVHRLQREAASLPPDMTDFDRSSLTEVVLLAKATGAANPTDKHALAAGLLDAARLLGLVAEAGQADDSSWPEWFADDALLSTVSEAIAEIEDEVRSAEWRTWWRRRYCLTVGQVTLNALSTLCSGTDTSELLLDLMPGQDTVFVISEPSPGGVGHVEAFRTTIASEPARMTRALLDALRPTSLETLDGEITALIRSEDGQLRQALEDLRRSWAAGHSAVASAVAALAQTLDRRGMTLGSPARKALTTRLAGAGAHADLLPSVAEWLDLRDEVRAEQQIEVDARLLGALLAERLEFDAVLRLGGAITRQVRARAIANVLWAWGYGAAEAAVHNQFAGRIGANVSTVRAHVDLAPPVFTLTEWTDNVRSALHGRLLDSAEVVLRVASADAGLLKRALLDLQVNPVEVGAILCHPITVGVDAVGGHVEAQIFLREAT